KKNSNVLAIGIMFFLFFMISFVTGLQNPMGVIAKAQFHATNAMSQMGNFCNFFAYLVLGIPAGLILKRKGYKVTALAAVSVGFLGVLISYISGVIGNYWVYLLGALVSGFSMCMLNTVVNPMLNTLGGGGNRGNQLIQMGGSLNSMGATLVPILAGYMIGEVTEKTQVADVNGALFLAMGIFALAFLIILFSAIPEPELEAAKAAPAVEEEGVVASVKGALKFRHFVLGILAIFLYLGIEVGIPNIANLFMTSGTAEGGLAIAAGIAGTFVGAYWFMMLIGRLTGSAIGAKVSSRAMLIATSAAGIVFLLLAMFLPKTWVITISGNTVPFAILLMVACGLCTSIMWGAIFNLAVEGLGKYTSIASGIFMTMVVGGGILPIVQGFAADKLGFLNSYWLIILYLVYMLWYAISGSKVKKD
ncbi:MAG: MFS transporter, partial [Bacteroidales bacterium]|nr:MFS transporter [Bacteroidales bacterium]